MNEIQVYLNENDEFKGHSENEMTILKTTLKDHAFDNIIANSEMHFKSSLFRPLSRQFHLNLAQNIFIGT